MAYVFGRNSKMNMLGIHEDLLTIMEEAILVSPIDFGIPKDGGLRTKERQQEMFKDITIKTNCDGVIRISKHQLGMAVDIFAYVNGKASWCKYQLAIIAGTIMSVANRLYDEGKISHRLVWGGTFGSKNYQGWDYPHFELHEV